MACVVKKKKVYLDTFFLCVINKKLLKLFWVYVECFNFRFYLIFLIFFFFFRQRMLMEI